MHAMIGAGKRKLIMLSLMNLNLIVENYPLLLTHICDVSTQTMKF